MGYVLKRADKMRFIYIIVIAFWLFCFASVSALMSPHLEVEHKIMTPICSLGSGAIPDHEKSVVTLTLKPVGDPIPLEVVFAIDYSESMIEADQNKDRLKATKKFVEILNSTNGDKAGLVYWNYGTMDSRQIPPTDNLSFIISILDKDISENLVTPVLGTDFNGGLNASINMFEDYESGMKKCILFLSDGDPVYEPFYSKSVLDPAKGAGIQIWTVGLSIDQEDEATILKEISRTTGGKYYNATNLTVEEVFIEIYREMTSLAGKDITVEYHAPKDLIYSIKHDRIEGDNKIFVWTPEDLYIGKRPWIESFQVSSKETGFFTLGNAPGSLVSYTTHDLKPEEIPIEDRQLEVIQCCDPCYPINFSVINITFEPGSIDIHIEGENFNFGSGSFCNNCTTIPTDPNGEPCERIVCVCADPTRPECAEVVADNGSKINNINIVQTTIFGSTPFWNETGDTVGVFNLTVSRPEAAIDAVFAFDVSGSMRLPYEGMGEEALAAFVEADFSNVSIVGWDEEDGEGADRLMTPPRPLVESEVEVLAALANLSGCCGETDQTVYSAGLREVLEVDDRFGDLMNGDEKIILFVTGPEEFRPGEGLDGLATELKRRGYAIYSVGVEIDGIESPLKYESLSTMASITGGRFYPIGGLGSDELREVLWDAAAHASSRAAPKDVVVTETLPAHLEVKETVPAGSDVNITKNPDGTTTLTWTAGGVRPGEARSLIILTTVKGALASNGIGAVAWPGGINITATDGSVAGGNVINMRTENGDVKIGEIS
jgi:hypothetical protein